MNRLQKLSRQLATEATRRKLNQKNRIDATMAKPASGSTRPHAPRKDI